MQVRHWRSRADRRQLELVEKFTVQHFSPYLWTEEAAEIAGGRTKFDNMTVWSKYFSLTIGDSCAVMGLNYPFLSFSFRSKFARPFGKWWPFTQWTTDPWKSW